MSQVKKAKDSSVGLDSGVKMCGKNSQFPKLDGTNWSSWILRLEMLLIKEDLWDVIEEQLPAEEDRSADWKKNDVKAKATIVLLLEDSQLSLVLDCVHAKDVYEALRKYHEEKVRSIRVALLRKIYSTNLLEKSDVEKHLHDYQELLDRLDATWKKLDEYSRHSSNQMHDRDQDLVRDRTMSKMLPHQQPQSIPSRSSQQQSIPQSGPSSGGSSTTASRMGPPAGGGLSQSDQQQQLPLFAIPKDAVRCIFPMPDDETQQKLKKFSKDIKSEMNESDIDDAIDKLGKTVKPDYYHAAVSQLFNDNIERDGKCREIVVRVIARMFEQKLISKVDYLHALEELFKLTEDFIIDLPQLFKYITTFYVMLLNKRFISLADVQNVAQDILQQYGAVLLKELLLQYESQYGKNATVLLWYESSLDFNDFTKLGSNDKIKKFLTDAKLDYLLDSDRKVLDMKTVGAQIKQFLKNNSSFVKIFDWITRNVGPERETSDEFIRTLTTAVIEHCIDNKRLNISEIQKWHQILGKYIDNNSIRELQAMYAIQRLVVALNHPQNLLHSILEQLYDLDVIMEGFTLWKDSTDPLEAAGKGVCLMGITQFMTMFIENSSDEDN